MQVLPAEIPCGVVWRPASRGCSPAFGFCWVPAGTRARGHSTSVNAEALLTDSPEGSKGLSFLPGFLLWKKSVGWLLRVTTTVGCRGTLHKPAPGVVAPAGTDAFCLFPNVPRLLLNLETSLRAGCLLKHEYCSVWHYSGSLLTSFTVRKKNFCVSVKLN